MDTSKYISRITGHVVVFGAGEIGAEIIRAVVVAGAPAVSFSYNSNREGAEKLAKELTAMGVKKVFFDTVNTTDLKDVERFAQAAEKHAGKKISVVINTIGISPNKPLVEQKLETVGEGIDNKGWREVFEVNVFGSFITTRAMAERMRKNKIKGVITLITSTNGINSHSQISVHYDASKAAQAHMMRNLAEYYAKYGIRINGVAPGWINTGMNKTLPPSERKKETKKIWTKRFAEVHEVALLVAFLSGTGGSYVHGQNYMVDGGYR